MCAAEARTAEQMPYTRDQLLNMYRLMVAIRTFEDRAERLHWESFLTGPFHSSLGQEAVAVGVCSALRSDDVITSTHRGHGHVLAKGGDMKRMLAELKGKRTGYSQGKGGSMHLADMELGIIGENGIVGGSIFLGTGAALGFQLEGSDRVAVAFFGDGALGQGILYESMSLASLWNLPVILVCENNQYAHSYPAREHVQLGNLTERARGFGVPGAVVDGTDAIAVRRATENAVERARTGGGPTVLQADCYRWRGHNLNDAHHLYRAREEVDRAQERDPLAFMRSTLTPLMTERELSEIEQYVNDEFEAARRFAEEGAAPDAALVYEGVPA